MRKTMTILLTGLILLTTFPAAAQEAVWQQPLESSTAIESAEYEAEDIRFRRGGFRRGGFRRGGFRRGLSRRGFRRRGFRRSFGHRGFKHGFGKKSFGHSRFGHFNQFGHFGRGSNHFGSFGHSDKFDPVEKFDGEKSKKLLVVPQPTQKIKPSHKLKQEQTLETGVKLDLSDI